MIQNTLEKEANLKNLVVKLLQDGNFSDSDTLESLFDEIKVELQNQQKNIN
ncbi:hypothetical protein BD31_I0242 [Candidatus Nitrosopumilus salaria BD31]|uniref:Uncharacterized protein n=1 Tax=Candidatus Nitrosopumilus salarius BD31 TaxID=859350 RepID=I3D4W2_9ARCH|nr:hypothetical protein [Candidatus Nitrosopumilus salaria]EIJ66755.1 hypothetical protein BD31_I0242 [Candidatus Nitrosopumilus salaria BD31]